MRRRLLVGIVVLVSGVLMMAAGAAGWEMYRRFGDESLLTAAVSRSEAEARILATLEDMRKTGKIQFGVPESDGRRLRVLAEAIGARNVVEIGTSTGYSGLWLCLGTLPTDGRVTTFEIDPKRAATAREVFRSAGVDNRITVVLGDAHKTLGTVKGPIDLVFIDADKEGYGDYLNQLLPLLRPGGLILAHNVERAPEFIQRVAADPQLDTVLLTQGSGLSATLKKR